MEVIFSDYGAAEVLQTRPSSIDPVSVHLKQNEVLIENTYAGINFLDIYFRSGSFKVGRLPYVCGVEGAGKVLRVGNAVPDGNNLIGKHVGHYTVLGSGTYAKYSIVPESAIFTLPDKITDDIAAASLTQGLTAHYLIHSSYPCKEGDVVVIHAAAGGTGLLASQMAKLRGATVIGICGGPVKVELARTVGKCDYVIDYIAYPEWPTKVREIAPQGVNAVYDSVGKSTLEGSLSVLRDKGYLITYGHSSGVPDPIPPIRLAAASLYMQHPNLAHYIANKDEREHRSRELFDWIASGKLKVTIAKVFPLADAADGQKMLEGRKALGKVLLKI